MGAGASFLLRPWPLALTSHSSNILARMTKLQKLQRYTGLIGAIVIVGALFAPGQTFMSPWDPQRDQLRAPKITPLDNTVLSRFMFFNDRNSPPGRLKNLTTEIFRCSSSVRTSFPEDTCIPARVFELSEHQKVEIAKLDATFVERLNRWETLFENYRAEFRAAAAAGRGWLPKSTELRTLEGDLGTAIYMDAKKNQTVFQGWIWFVHILALLIGLVLVFAREHLGAMILWPFSLVFSGLRKGAKVAKDLHEKV